MCSVCAHTAPRLTRAQDNVINQMVLATYLKKLGYTYSACANGREAVDAFAGGRGADAVIMDMEMPVLDGREATRRIRALERGRGVCIIALSGNARPGLMQDAYDTGLDDYLTKPCSMDELARMLAKWEQAREDGAGHAQPQPRPQA
jgi:two-component system sensor histidine kinase/response regulator